MSSYDKGTTGYPRSAQKLRVENALAEITNNATLKAAALANLGLTDVAGSRVAVATGKNLNVSNTLTLVNMYVLNQYFDFLYGHQVDNKGLPTQRFTP